MKVAVINFSGNVGKSTIGKHLLQARIPNAEYIAVETLNADEGSDETVRGKDFGILQEQIQLIDDAVIDVGASNVEDFVKLMQHYRGSHVDFDYFVVPAVKDSKQIRDTIATNSALNAMGVPTKKIRVVFNMLDFDETVESAFFPLIEYHKDKKNFTLRTDAAIIFSELYQKLRSYNLTIPELLADNTDYKAKLREAKDQAEKERAVAMISMRRLAISAKENLDTVYATISK